MEHLHKHENFDVLIYNIKYLTDGKYLVRFSSKELVSKDDKLNSQIILRTPNNFFEVIIKEIISMNKLENGYFSCISECTDPLFDLKAVNDSGQNYYQSVELNPKHLDKILEKVV